MSAESEAHDRDMREHGGTVPTYMYMDAMESRQHYMAALESVLSVPGVREALQDRGVNEDVRLAYDKFAG